MICTLTRNQEIATLQLIGKIISRAPALSPEAILKNVYDSVYEAFVKKNDTKNALRYGLGMTEYAAKNLYILLSQDTASPIRQAIMTMSGNKDAMTAENIQRYTKIEELKKLLNIKDELPKRIMPEIGSPTVQPYLQKIQNAFPQIKDRATYMQSHAPFAKWSFSILRNKDGNIKLPEVTDFLNRRKIKNSSLNINNTATRSGTLADFVVREFIKSGRASFEDFNKKLMTNPKFLDLFSKFSENTNTPISDQIDPLLLRYAEDFLKDMSYALNFIQNEYKDYYITDLSGLLDSTELSDKDKDRFFLYSSEIGLKGELDLIGIDAKGNFKIIDIKTTDGTLNKSTLDKYNTQVSIYDLIIETATGLKSVGNNDIILLTTSISNPGKILGRTQEGRYKVGIVAYERVTNENKNKEILIKDIQDYKKELDEMYKSEITVTKVGTGSPKDFILNPLTRGRLKMLFKKSENLSTYEDLQAGKNWLKSVFPELDDKQIQIIKIANSNVGGEFFIDAIKLYEQSNKGVAYHEGWHRFTQLYLTPAEKVDLYSKVRSLNVNFTSRDGRELNTKTLDNRDAEEYLAEEFRKYAQNRDGYKKPEIKGFFNKIWAALKAIFEYFQKNSFEDLYEQVYTGSFNKSNFNINNAEFTHLNSFFVNSTDGRSAILDNLTFLKFRDFSDFRLNQYMSVNDITITDLLNTDGLSELKNFLRSEFENLKSNLEITISNLQDEIDQNEDESITDRMKTSQVSLGFNLDSVNKILETNEEGELVNFPDFLRAFFKTSKLETMRKFVGKNIEKVNKIVDEQNLLDYLSNEEKIEEEGEELQDFDDNPKQGTELEYDRNGNEKEALENARTELKDFFAGIPRRKSSDLINESASEEYEDASGIPIVLSKQEAFYKTLEILQGSVTIDNIEKALNNPVNMLKFPELLSIKERLLGGSQNEGLITKLKRITEELNNGDTTNLQDFRRLKSFLMHFTHVMTMRNVKFTNFTVKLNYSIEDQKLQGVAPLTSRDSLELIINNIIGDFTKGFQTNAIKGFKNDPKKSMSAYDIMYDIFMSGQSIEETLRNNTQYIKYIYDPVFNSESSKFYFNPLFARGLAQSTNPTDAELKTFFNYMGINLNDKIYENSLDRGHLIEAYDKLKSVLSAFYAKSSDQVVKHSTSEKLKIKLKEWKIYSQLVPTLEEGSTGRIATEARVTEIQTSLKGYLSSIFSSDPVNTMLFDGQDKKLRSNSRNRIFAINRLVFENLAKIEKKYHKRFSSGSMLVLDSLQFSYFLPNQMIIIESILNKHINNVSEMDEYPELNHLNPRINPQIWNSFIFRNIFNSSTGDKIPGAVISLQNIAQVSLINDKGELEAKKMSELREDEKFLYDFLMVISEGSSEIRRLETSNTAYRLGITRNNGIKDLYIKPVKIGSDGFKNAGFQNIIKNYIQHAATKYKYNQDPKNRDLDQNHANKDMIGVFDEMLGLTSPKLKAFVDEYKGDMNLLMHNIETTDPELYKKITNEIIDYFEEITLSNSTTRHNTTSYKTKINSVLSTKSEDTLFKLNIFQGENVFVQLDHNLKIRDSYLRDFIANDFIMAMEDSILFFGDYTYYKDPSKRRKIIGNNGSINIMGNIFRNAEAAERKVNSLTSVYHNNKGTVLNKNYGLVSKVLTRDIHMASKILDIDENDQMDMVRKKKIVRDQIFGLNQTYEDILNEPGVQATIEVFKDMALGDAAAWISLDTYRTMLQREMRWDENDEREFERQQLILKKNLGETLTEDQENFIKRSYSTFNVAKFATTGPVYSDTQSPFKPTFDKMGLRVLLPSTDWNSTMRPVFEYMLQTGVDYVVNDSGSKGYQSKIYDAMSEDGRSSTFDAKTVEQTYHAGGFFKNQQNTTGTHDTSTFSSQLRGIFFEIMLIREQHGKVSTHLKNSYNNFIKTLSDYILVNSSRALSEMGLDQDGNIKDNATFINYLKERLQAVGEVGDDLLDLLSKNTNGQLSTYLEALPFQRNIGNLIAGIVDDNFRKIRLNGTKFYQSPEIGTTLVNGGKNLPKEQRGSIELKWHDLEFDEKGRAISTSPVEAKVNYNERQWGSLMKTIHPDGDIISNSNDIVKNIRRLNEAINNPEWLSRHRESIIFLGVRIPLQDINFSSHMIIKEFLQPEVGDMIILPPEFYMQTGSDNDIDSVTATFKFLNEKGKVISKPVEDYKYIIDSINEKIAAMNNEESSPAIITNTIEEDIADFRQDFIDNNIYFAKGKSLQDLDRELEVVETDGLKIFQGLLSPKSTLSKIVIAGEHEEQIEWMNSIMERMNTSNKSKIKDPNKEELLQLIKKRNNYIKGLTNNLVNSIQGFMSLPENYDFLTETDSINKIKELAARTLTMKGKPTLVSDLGKSISPLQNISYLQNVANHKNNAEIRSILGSIVKFRRILTTLAELKLTLKPEYRGGSVTNLLNVDKLDNQLEGSGMIIGNAAKKIMDKVYTRQMYTPLLYKKDTFAGTELSIFDENGERITKNLSMLTSSLLDLFKNQDIFPSLGISWLNVKPMLLAIAQGVPLDRTILFLNNPIVQEVQKALDQLGTDAQDRHALVKVSQDLFDAEIHGYVDPSDDLGVRTNKSAYNVMQQSGGNLIINKYMRRHPKASQEYLSKSVDRNTFRLTEKELSDFTQEFAEYMKDETLPNYKRNLKTFINKNTQYAGLSRNILAYYSTMLEDGDLFYKSFVKAINRDSSKHNTYSSMATADAAKKIRLASQMVDKKFEHDLENNTTQAPFFKDHIVKNVISNRMPEILRNPNEYFRTKFISLIENLSNEIYGTTEERNKVEEKILADFIEFIYKNFYIMKEGNSIYEYFEYDISPLLRNLVQGEANFKKFMEDFTTSKEANLTEDTKITTTYSDVIFSNQPDLIRRKYPELLNLKLINELLTKRESGVDPGKESAFEVKDVLNMLEQNYMYLNLAINPSDRQTEEEEVRDEWKKLLNFDLSTFPSIENQIMKNPERIAVYRDPQNITEIRRFAKLLAYYSLAQGSHLSSARGSFSHLIPPTILKDVIETSIDNFNDYMNNYLKDSMKSGVDNMLNNFEKLFKDMNGELGWQNKQAPEEFKKPVITEDEDFIGDTDMLENPPKAKEVYKPYKKSHTGKLYSKTGDSFIAGYKKKLMNGPEKINNFVIDIFKKIEDDPLNCTI